MKILNKNEGSTESPINTAASPRENSCPDDVAAPSNDGVINYKAEIQKFLKYRDEVHRGTRSVQDYIHDPETCDGSKRALREITDAVQSIGYNLRGCCNLCTASEIIRQTNLAEKLVLEIAALSEAELRPLLDNERDAAKILWRLSGKTGLPLPPSSEKQRYSLLLEGLKWDIKIHRLTPEELEIVGPLVDEGANYSGLSMNEELGLGWDPGNPNVDMMGDFYDLGMLDLKLLDPDGWVVIDDFSGLRVQQDDSEWDPAPEKDGLTLVQMDSYEGLLLVYAVDSHDAPSVEDFCVKVGHMRIGDDTYATADCVLFRGEYLECDDDVMETAEEAEWTDTYAEIV